MPDKSLNGKTFKVSDKVIEKIKLALNAFDGPRTTEGYERANNIVKDPIISLALLKKINHFFRNADEEGYPYKLTGGEYGKKVFYELEKQLRDGKSIGRKSKMDGGMMNTHYDEHEKDGNANPTQVTIPTVDKANTLRESIKKINKLINY